MAPPSLHLLHIDIRRALFQCQFQPSVPLHGPMPPLLLRMRGPLIQVAVVVVKDVANNNRDIWPRQRRWAWSPSAYVARDLSACQAPH